MKLFRGNRLGLTGLVFIVFAFVYFLFVPKDGLLALTAFFPTFIMVAVGLVLIVIGWLKEKNRDGRINAKGKFLSTAIVVAILVLILFMFLGSILNGVGF